MKYLAILKDSLCETIDFKVFYVLIGLCLLLTLVAASFTFHRLPVEQVLQKNMGAEIDVQEIQELERSFFAPTARYRVILKAQAANPEEFQRALQDGIKRNYQQRDQRIALIKMQLMIEERRADSRPGEPPTSPSAPDRPLATTLNELVEQYLLSVAGVRTGKLLDDSAPEKTPGRMPAEIEVNWAELRHSHKIGLLFGVWKFDLNEQPMGEAVVSWMQSPLVGWIAGWVGIIIAVVVTAGFIPNMLRKGTVDFLIVKPISRPTLLIYKYMGGLTFVFLNALVLVGGTWIAFGFTTSNWSPWYLTSVLVLTLFFAILYSFSALIGVLTRSTIAAILLTIGFWALLWVINQVFVVVHFPVIEKRIGEEAAWVLPIVDWIHYVLPKPGSLDILNSSLLLQSYGAEEFAQLQNEAMSKFSWSQTIYTSLVFIAVMLGLGCWRFSRRDY